MYFMDEAFKAYDNGGCKAVADYVKENIDDFAAMMSTQGGFHTVVDELMTYACRSNRHPVGRAVGNTVVAVLVERRLMPDFDRGGLTSPLQLWKRWQAQKEWSERHLKLCQNGEIWPLDSDIRKILKGGLEIEGIVNHRMSNDEAYAAMTQYIKATCPKRELLR